MSLGTDYVVLDQTCFFPESTEQASDRGFIDDFAIRGAIRVGREVRHLVDRATTPNFKAGDVVACKVDWDRRYRAMRLHTAQHLLRLAVQKTSDAGPPSCGVVTHEAASVEYSSIDLGPIELHVLQSWVDTIISQQHLTIHESDQSLPERRFWHIDGLAAFPCDGTHVRLTGEVGSVLIQQVRRANGNTQFRVELAEI